MLIVCEGCGTRFDFPSGRLPAEGGRVRCSRCHHSFLVARDPNEETQSSDPSELPQDTATLTVEVEKPENDTEEPDLDNPEFLFDDPSDVRELSAMSSDASDGEPLPLDGSTLSGIEPGLGLDSEAELDTEAEPEFLGLQDDVTEIHPGNPVDLAAIDGEPSMLGKVEPETAPELPPSLAHADESFEGLVESIDPLDADDDFDLDLAPSTQQSSAPEPSRGFMRSRSTGVPAAVELDTEPMDASGFSLLPWVAVIVGLAIVSAGMHVMLETGIRPLPGPVSYAAAGWNASDIEAYYARDIDGKRTLVVRGGVSGPKNSQAPRLQLHFLDEFGSRVGPPVDADSSENSDRFRFFVPAPSADVERFTLDFAASGHTR